MVLHWLHGCVHALQEGAYYKCRFAGGGSKGAVQAG